MSRLLTYDVVMATRNRSDAVALSLPLLLRQTRLPEQIVVVDSSDDPEAIAPLVQRIAADARVPVSFRRAAPGLTHQRNVGLAECSADIVIFPDDDSLFYEDTAAAIMGIYEADTAGAVAGVAGRPVETPPATVRGDLGTYAAEEKKGPLGTALRSLRQRGKEATGVLNPFLTTGHRLGRQQRAQGRRAPPGATLVPYMTGFRMSFRRAAITPVGFDEALRKYGWFEDVDASFAALRTGLVVAADEGRVYHHRAAAARDNGHRMGLWAILNRGYVVMKHVRANPAVFPAPGREILRLRAYCLARALAYRLLARDAYERDRARGAWDGLRLLGRLTTATAETLTETYSALERSLPDG